MRVVTNDRDHDQRPKTIVHDHDHDLIIITMAKIMTCSGLLDEFELPDKVVDELVDEVEVPDKLDKGERDCAMSLQACCLFSPSWK